MTRMMGVSFARPLQISSPMKFLARSGNLSLSGLIVRRLFVRGVVLLAPLLGNHTIAQGVVGTNLIGIGIGVGHSYAYGLNDSGQVVGYAGNADNTAVFAFIYSAATGMNNMGSLGGGGFTYGASINNSGAVTGISNAIRNAPPLIQVSQHAFVYSAGAGMSDIGTLDGRFESGSHGYGINNPGQVAGGASTDGGQRAFVYSTVNGMTSIGTLGGDFSSGYAINDAGQVTGQSTLVTGARHAFLYTPGAGMVDIGTLGGGTSDSWGINNAGQVTGWSNTIGNAQHAFIYSSSTGMVDIGTLGAFAVGRDINNSGQVVGASFIPNEGAYHAFVYSQGTMYDLNTIFSPFLSDGKTPGFTRLTDGQGINDVGQIAGYGDYWTGTQYIPRAFIARIDTVSDEGTTLLFLGISLFGLGALRRRFAAETKRPGVKRA